MEAIATRVEAIAIRLEATAIRLEATAIRLEASAVDRFVLSGANIHDHTVSSGVCIGKV